MARLQSFTHSNMSTFNIGTGIIKMLLHCYSCEINSQLFGTDCK